MARRILIVDDNAALRESLVDILALEGHEVSSARDGAAAMAQLERDPLPDLVLLDLMLPGALGGREVVAAIRASPRLERVRVLVVTGLPPGPQSRRAIAADGFLTKPFGIPQLFEAIRAVADAA